MLREHFKNVEKTLISNLEMDKLRYSKGIKGPFREDSIKTESEGIRIDSHSDVLQVMNDFRDLVEKCKKKSVTGEVTITHDGFTVPSGRYDYYDHSIFTVRYKVFGEITESKVKSKARRYIESKLEKDTGRDFISADCRIMKMYMEGTINWEDVVKAHMGDC